MITPVFVILLLATSLLVSLLAYPRVLRFANGHHVMDKRNARKLQHNPVPVMGGVVVYCGILAGGLLLSFFSWDPLMIYGFVGISIMMFMGMCDDLKELSVSLRFLVEIGLILSLIYLSGIFIDDFHGFWFHHLPLWFSIPISLISGVGIINAVNLIDGVDGYSSGYGIFASICFGILFWVVGAPIMLGLTVITVGSLIPFFLHNVFGQRSKMFIGDSGTLMLGLLMSIFVFYTLSSQTICAQLEDQGMGLIAFTLAVTCIPVFDTLRVMTNRILHGTSPFKADKTHLHHLYIDMGFSHFGTTSSILFQNLFVVLVWYLSWQLGASPDVQAYVVVAMGLLLTFLFYALMRHQQSSNGPLWHLYQRIGRWTHKEHTPLWLHLQHLLDRTL